MCRSLRLGPARRTFAAHRLTALGTSSCCATGPASTAPEYHSHRGTIVATASSNNVGSGSTPRYEALVPKACGYRAAPAADLGSSTLPTLLLSIHDGQGRPRSRGRPVDVLERAQPTFEVKLRVGSDDS
jgi:hypothetical protein